MRVLVLLCAGSTMVVPAVLTAQSITPKFAWPVGATAEVTVTSRTAGQVAGGAANDRKVYTKSVVEAHPDGLRIVNGPGRLEGWGPMALRAPDPAQLMVLRSAFVVTRDGQFLRLDDTTTLRRVIDSTLAPVFEQIRGGAPQMLPMMQRAASIEMMSASAAQTWRQQVTDLIGKRWNLGDSVTGTIKQLMPVAPGMLIDVPRLLRFEGVTACPAGSNGTCWRFATRTVITKVAMRGIMAELMSLMGATDASMLDQIPMPEFTATGSIVVDAATLLPLLIEQNTRAEGGTAEMQLGGTGFITTVYRWTR